MSLFRPTGLIAAAAGVLLGCATSDSEPDFRRVNTVPIYPLSGGDDAATQAFWYELQDAYRARGFTFDLIPGALIVRIPTHVDARGRTHDRIRYVVEFASRQADGSERPLGSITGRCRLGACSSDVLRETARVINENGLVGTGDEGRARGPS